MSAFASPRAAAFVEEALRLTRHEAIRSLTGADGSGEGMREEIILAIAEALVTSRTHSTARALAEEQAASDDVLCSWRWGAAPEFDRTSQHVGFPILFGRRCLRLWIPLQDLIGMANSYAAGMLRAGLRSHLDPAASEDAS